MSVKITANRAHRLATFLSELTDLAAKTSIEVASGSSIEIDGTDRMRLTIIGDESGQYAVEPTP